MFAALACAAVFRVAIVTAFSTSTPDGDQYLELSRSIHQRGTFAFDDLAGAPAWTRLPGHPLFLVLAEGGRASDDPIRVAVVANALLDVATALLVFLILMDHGARRAAPLGFAAVVLSPVLTSSRRTYRASRSPPSCPRSRCGSRCAHDATRRTGTPRAPGSPAAPRCWSASIA
jgi:hypothetical protein